MKTKTLVAALMVCVAQLAHGQASELARPDAATESRLKGLAEELRCLVCQNQTIADSSAPLAHDLRNQIREQIASGRSDADIRDYMVERYGDFVLYRPPLRPTTVLLWVGPFALLLVGAGVFGYAVRRRRVATQDALSPERRVALEALLEESDGAAAPGSMKKGART